MILRHSLLIVCKARIGGHVSTRTACRMLAYAVLAKLAHGEGSQAFRLHVGAMRGAFRKGLAS